MVYQNLLVSQPIHPLLRILYLRNAGVSVFPKVEEFLVMLYSVALPTLFMKVRDFLGLRVGKGCP